MKTIVDFAVILFLLLFSSYVTAQDQAGPELQVTVTNIATAKGTIEVGLYHKAELFLRKTFKSISTEAVKGSVVVTFKDLPEGTYAISLYHDKDQNGELNTNILGIPKEPYAASNNAKRTFGPPRWEDANFEVKNGKNAQTIKL